MNLDAKVELVARAMKPHLFAKPDHEIGPASRYEREVARQMARVAITALEQSDAEREQPWQPIETLPDDDSLYMLCNANDYRFGPICWRADIYRKRNAETETFNSSIEAKAMTHWMPLPKTPERLSSHPGNEG